MENICSLGNLQFIFETFSTNCKLILMTNSKFVSTHCILVAHVVYTKEKEQRI